MNPEIAALDPQLRLMARLMVWPRTFTTRNVPVIRRLTALSKPRAVTGVAVSTVEHGQLFTPTDLAPGRPALLWIHGGGYLIGQPEMEAAFASQVARDLDITVLSARYRLAPEHVFPAQLDDTYAALRWLASCGDVDATKLAVGGMSAGGGLAAGLAQHAVDQAEIDVAFQLLVYPMLDDRTCLRDDLTARWTIMWNNVSNNLGWTSYLGMPPGSAGVSAPAAPARRDDLSGLPPAWIGVGSCDPFHDEDVAYAQRLGDAGVKCELEVVPGAFHGFDKVAARTPIARSFVAAQITALRTGLQL